MSQTDLLKKLKNGKITVGEFLKLSEDPSLDKYKLTREEFLADIRISDTTRNHELMHAEAYEKEGLEVELYFFGETQREAATTATKKSLIKWLEGKTRINYLDLLKMVLSAPGEDMSHSDKKLLDILNS